MERHLYVYLLVSCLLFDEGSSDRGDSGLNASLNLDVSTTEAPTTHKSTWNVSTVLIPPFLEEKNDSVATGNDRYEGFVKDYLDLVTADLGLNYTFIIREKYGSKQGDTWTGVIGDVVNQVSTLAAGPLTVTVYREQVVDFIWPILRFEAVIVMQKTREERNLEELLKEDDVTFGVARDSPLALAINDSDDQAIQKVWKNIGARGTTMENNTAGFEQAYSNPHFAFFTDELTADWVLREEPCTLRMIKTGFFKRYYAFAVPNYSPMRDRLNEQVLDLEANGKTRELYEKWWGEPKCGPDSLADYLRSRAITATAFSPIHVLAGVIAVISTMMYGRFT